MQFFSPSCGIKPEILKVAITGASGQIGYASVFRMINEEIFGPNKVIDLRLLEIPQSLPGLQGIRMELVDCGSPLLSRVICTDNAEEAFEDADWCILIGSSPRGPGMERKDLLEKNAQIFVQQGKAIATKANPTCKVFVVGNPCNTNAYIIKEITKTRLSPKNIFSMVMLDQLRACSLLAEKSGVSVRNIKNICVWGNHSSTQVPMFEHAIIDGKSCTEVISDLSWLQGTFTQEVRERGAKVIKTRGHSSAGSAANAMLSSVQFLAHPDIPKNRWGSISLESDGQYGVEPGLIFGYPTIKTGEKITVVEGLELTPWAKEQLAKTIEELISERNAVTQFLPT